MANDFWNFSTRPRLEVVLVVSFVVFFLIQQMLLVITVVVVVPPVKECLLARICLHIRSSSKNEKCKTTKVLGQVLRIGQVVVAVIIMVVIVQGMQCSILLLGDEKKIMVFTAMFLRTIKNINSNNKKKTMLSMIWNNGLTKSLILETDFMLFSRHEMKTDNSVPLPALLLQMICIIVRQHETIHRNTSICK